MGSRHSFVANHKNRRIQISISEDEDVPCAFIKNVGIDNNDDSKLLQIIVTQDDLMADQCSDLFASWIANESDENETEILASQFGK